MQYGTRFARQVSCSYFRVVTRRRHRARREREDWAHDPHPLRLKSVHDPHAFPTPRQKQSAAKVPPSSVCFSPVSCALEWSACSRLCSVCCAARFTGGRPAPAGPSETAARYPFQPLHASLHGVTASGRCAGASDVRRSAAAYVTSRPPG